VLTFGVLVLAAASIGFERLDPSIGLTLDLRLTNLRLVAALALLAWLVWRGLSGRWPSVPRQVAWPIAAWLGVLVVSASLAPTYQRQSLAFVRDIAFGIALGWAVYDVARSPSRQRWIATAFVLSGLGVAALGLAEAANVRPVVEGLAGFRTQANFGVGEVPRVASTLTHPNIAAMLLGMALPLQLAWLVSVRQRWAQVLLGVGVAMELAVLVFTVSRAGMLVTELVLGAMLLIGLRQRHRRLIVSSLAAVVCLPVLLGLVALREPILRLHLTSESVDSWYRATYSTPTEVSAEAGGTSTVPVRLENTGDRTWDASGAHAFALSYHLEDASGNSVTYDGPRTALPLDVAPGTSVELQARIEAPATQGRYVIDWDGVQEAVTWFSWAGTPVARTYLNVLGPAADATATYGSAVTLTSPPADLQPPPPGRLTQWRIALRMARNRPALGIGPDNFRWMYGDFAGLRTWDTGSHANSLYFEWLADTGVVGFALFAWLGWRLLRASYSKLLSAPVPDVNALGDVWIWRLGLAASLTAWFLHGVFDYFYEPLPTNMAFWLVAGLALAAARSATPKGKKAAECALLST
jgi:O-antigen ligase